MGWFGKIAGGAVGLLIGGPLGAILGAVLGHAIFDNRQSGLKEYRPFTKQDETQAVYFLSLFSILGKLSKIDGIVTRGEIEVAERFMDQINLSGEERLFAIETFKQAKNSPYSFDSDIILNIFAGATPEDDTAAIWFIAKGRLVLTDLLLCLSFE